MSPIDTESDVHVSPTPHDLRNGFNGTVLHHRALLHQHHQQNLEHSASLPTVAITWSMFGRLQIPLYTAILLLAIIGNTLVILTLIQNRRMRTITNVFLLNLAVSDILLGVLCMPFTLIGTLLRDFVFGGAMCKLLPFLQASLVSVSAWTLVAISCERYFAICHPLSSRRWQTLSHAYKLIALIWSMSLLLMSPIAALSRLIPTSHGHHKCREYWPENTQEYERTFNLFLDMVLLVLPLIVLGTTYSLITNSLWQSMRGEKVFRKHPKQALTYENPTHSGKYTNSLVEVYINPQGTPSSRCPSSNGHNAKSQSDTISAWNQLPIVQQSRASSYSHDLDNRITGNPALRRTNVEKNLQNRKRVIKMLFVVVLEFFICWTPLYVINTIALFDPELVYHTFGYTSISFCQLLAYSSSCCNPITYCFMNRGFRKAFLNLFRCCRRHELHRKMSGGAVGGGGTAGGVAGGSHGAAGLVLLGHSQLNDNEVSRLQRVNTQRLCRNDS